MFLPTKIGKLTPVLLTTPLLLWTTFAAAHKVEVSGDIAALWHVEPNHSPKAGEPAQVWIALTQEGGAIVPLEQCDCKLAIYSVPRTEGATPVLEPSLEAIATEHYQGIPGAEVIFPEVGEYELQLSGAPQAEADFQPFELSYTAIVGRGTAASAATSTTQTTDIQPSEGVISDDSQTLPANQTDSLSLPLIILIAALLLGGIGLMVRQSKLLR